MAVLIQGLLVALLASGCGLGYIVKSGYHQAKILSRRVPLEVVLQEPSLPEETRRKLLLVVDAKRFAETELGLVKSRNYSHYVQLDRPSVSYVLSAAPQFQLVSHRWSYPIVGELPYRGFFSVEEAKQEADVMKNEGFDTVVRGVAAYSTLGYFRDPVLSSMLKYQDHELVSLIIHETVHATLYIKSNADFNERLAEFLGQKGAEAFFQSREGPGGPTLTKISNEVHDGRIFSIFITREIESLKRWFETTSPMTQELKTQRLLEIQNRFKSEILPQMKSNNFTAFGTQPLNNAEILLYGTYNSKQEDIEKVFLKLGGDFKKAMTAFKTLEGQDQPEESLLRL